MVTHTHIHTHTHDNYYNPRCAHAHRGLIRYGILFDCKCVFPQYPKPCAVEYQKIRNKKNILYYNSNKLYYYCDPENEWVEPERALGSTVQSGVQTAVSETSEGYHGHEI